MLLSEIMILRQQILVLERLNKKRITFSVKERLSLSFWATIGDDKRVFKRAAIIFSPVTLLRLHRNLVNNKYRKLYGSKNKKRGAKGKPPDLVKLILSIKRNNPEYGIEKIEGLLGERGHIVSDTTILRILRKHGLTSDHNKLGPSWLSFIGSSFNGLWSVDMFKIESAFLSSYVVMVAIDIYSRKIINFSVRRYPVDGGAVCQMFQEVCKNNVLPKKISTDNDPLFL
jgi:transposase InsO family protein